MTPLAWFCAGAVTGNLITLVGLWQWFRDAADDRVADALAELESR